MLKPSILFPAYIIDLDGTVYLGDHLLPTVKDTISKLKNLNCKLVYITNEASRSRSTSADKLTALGIPTQADEIINSSLATINYLNHHYPRSGLFVIGEASLHEELQVAGYRLVADPQAIDVVVVSSDHNFNYSKLKNAFDAILAGAKFIATNADRTCPLDDGGEEPDALPIIAAIEACTQHTLDRMVGKPSTDMAEAALQQIGLPASSCLLVGDNLETDIQMGKKAGITTALVTTGVSRNRVEIPTSLQPDFILSQLSDLLPE